jgi:hypothetical protein
LLAGHIAKQCFKPAVDLLTSPPRLNAVLYRAPASDHWEPKPLDWAMDRIASLVKCTMMQHVVDMRNELIDAGACHGGLGFDGRLTAINAILSCLFGIEFPHRGLQWRRICESREALRNLLKET